MLIPLVKNNAPIATGAEKFLRLEAGFQQQVLGRTRFEMFKAGKPFDEFVTSRFDAQLDGSRVERFFVKNLSDLSG